MAGAFVQVGVLSWACLGNAKMTVLSDKSTAEAADK
jgi:hypothetical protein